MSIPAEKVREYLDSNEVGYTEEDGLFRTALRGNNVAFNIAIMASEDSTRIEVHVLHDLIVPEAKRAVAADFVTRLNWLLGTVKYDLDMDDGELRVTCVVEFEDAIPTSAMIEDMVSAPAAVADLVYPVLVKVLFAEVPSKEAFSEVVALMEMCGDTA